MSCVCSQPMSTSQLQGARITNVDQFINSRPRYLCSKQVLAPQQDEAQKNPHLTSAVMWKLMKGLHLNKLQSSSLKTCMVAALMLLSSVSSRVLQNSLLCRIDTGSSFREKPETPVYQECANIQTNVGHQLAEVRLTTWMSEARPVSPL